MIDYKGVELLKDYSIDRYNMSLDELYFAYIVSEFFPIKELFEQNITALPQSWAEAAAAERFNKIVTSLYRGADSCLYYMKEYSIYLIDVNS